MFSKSFIDGAAQVDATLQAISVNNEVELLARPSLTVINNQEGEIQIGSQVPVLNKVADPIAQSLMNAGEFVDDALLSDYQKNMNADSLPFGLFGSFTFFAALPSVVLGIVRGYRSSGRSEKWVVAIVDLELVVDN